MVANMVVLKRKIIVDGREVEVPVFETKIEPGKDISDDTLDSLRQEERLEKEIQNMAKKIEELALKFDTLEKNLDYFFEVGKLLQFVDNKGYLKFKGRIWQRLAHDLKPDLLFGKKKTKKESTSPEKESKRNIEDMYKLAKFPINSLHRATWNQWDEILKFKELYKDKELLNFILKECGEGVSGIPLRRKIKELRGRVKRG